MTNLSTTQVAQLTATLTGGGFKRSATKAEAVIRFAKVAAGKGLDGHEILRAEDPKAALEAALNAQAEAAAKAALDARVEEAKATTVSPGLARLRAHPKAEELRNAAQADVAAAFSGEYPFQKGRKGKAALAVLEVEAPAPEKVAKPKKVKAAKPKAEGTASRTRADLSAKITAVVDNPKKPGSRAHACFSVYRAGQTVADFIAACAKAGIEEAEAKSNLSWDRRKGFITIEG